MGHTKYTKRKWISLIIDHIHKLLVVVLIIIENPKNHASEVRILCYALALKHISPYNSYLTLNYSLEHNIFIKPKQIAKRNFFYKSLILVSYSHLFLL